MCSKQRPTCILHTHQSPTYLPSQQRVYVNIVNITIVCVSIYHNILSGTISIKVHINYYCTTNHLTRYGIEIKFICI